MTPLTILLIIKIGVTLVTVSIPFLVLPKAKIDNVLGVETNSPAIYRLYGVAITALLVGYSGGIHQIAQGIYPIGVIAMGLFSNAGAATALFATKLYKRTRFLFVFFAFIALGLLVAAFAPDWSISPILGSASAPAP